jgi:hypothetical protein
MQHGPPDQLSKSAALSRDHRLRRLPIKWVITGFLGWPIDANVYKWAQIIVGLLCIIAIVAWLSGVLGLGGGLPHFWQYR